MVTGTLFGLGLGPGDPELLTLKALRILRAVPVIAYPQAEGRPSLARTIAALHLPGEQREIAMPLPMSPEPELAQRAYDTAASAIADHLRAGRDVAVLCEGDPLFYGSFLYLAERLQGAFPVSVVPGISSVMAAAAAARRPLSRRDDAVLVLPGTLPDRELERRIAAAETVAILKLGRHFARVKALLERLGLLETSLYAERVGQAEERLLPLAETGEAAPYFALILVDRAAARESIRP